MTITKVKWSSTSDDGKMKIRSPGREQARRVYYGDVSEVNNEILAKVIPEPVTTGGR